MNEKIFRWNVFLVISVYVVAIIIGIKLRKPDISCDDHTYTTFKDLIPLVIAIPAAWLGYCFQRRQSYLKDIRDLWSKMVAAVQDAIQYTHLNAPAQSDYARVLKGLSIAIDEVRGVFANVGEAEQQVGIFPFEGLKAIYQEISALGFEKGFSQHRAPVARKEILESWTNLRRGYLKELKRGIPISADSPFLD